MVTAFINKNDVIAKFILTRHFHFAACGPEIFFKATRAVISLFK